MNHIVTTPTEIAMLSELLAETNPCARVYLEWGAFQIRIEADGFEVGKVDLLKAEVRAIIAEEAWENAIETEIVKTKTLKAKTQ